MAPVIGIVRLPHGENIDLPAYETAGAAGMDLRAAVDETHPSILEPGQRLLVPTGLVLEIPDVAKARDLLAKQGIRSLSQEELPVFDHD